MLEKKVGWNSLRPKRKALTTGDLYNCGMRGLCCFGTLILKTHYNSSSLKEIMTVFGRVILVNNFFLRFYVSVFSLQLQF